MFPSQPISRGSGGCVLRRAIGPWVAAWAALAASPQALAQLDFGAPEERSAAAPAAPGRPVIKVPADIEQKKLLRFSRFRTSLRQGDSIGEIKTGSGCAAVTRLSMNARTQQAVMGPMPRAVRDELSGAGYRDPTRTQAKLFEEDTTAQKIPDLLLGGMLEEFQTSYCSTESGARTNGKVRVKVRWEVYDPFQRKVIYSMTAEGAYETAGDEALREGAFFAMAYRDAVRQLLADQEFYDTVIIRAGAGDALVPVVAEKPAQLVLKRTAPLTDALSKNMTLTRAAVVTVSHAGGTGSGFFISEGGHVITNSHVVGASRFVKVTLATGRELVGEVVQRDAGRDVALIKTEGSNFPTLSISGDDVNVGAEVTAIGSPLGQALSGTVTRGIVSAHRTINGRRYIQSDVPILPGNSGGPLLDRSGRVVGIAVAMLGNTRVGFFVPIQEALGSLGIKMAGTP